MEITASSVFYLVLGLWVMLMIFGLSPELIGTDISPELPQDVIENLLSEHDWLRALRMTSYGFLLYGPGSYAWYQFLELVMPKQTVQNLLIKVDFPFEFPKPEDLIETLISPEVVLCAAGFTEPNCTWSNGHCCCFCME